MGSLFEQFGRVSNNRQGGVFSRFRTFKAKYLNQLCKRCLPTAGLHGPILALERTPMPRRALERSSDCPYHVTLRVNNREPFPLPLKEVWNLLNSEIYRIQLLFKTQVHAVVLMPNHIHLLLTVSEGDLGVVMNQFVSALTLQTHLRSGRSGRLFGNRYHWSIIKSSRYYGHALKYVYRNPVKAKLCRRVEDYAFSSLAALIGRYPLLSSIQHPPNGIDGDLPWRDKEPYELLPWLNEAYSDRIDHLIGLGMKRAVFDELKDRVNRRPFRELERLV